eukprot:scaffold108798_cov23-Cyclotella_meneghiniana.AAC.1
MADYYSRNADVLCQQMADYYSRNADVKRQQRVKNYHRSKGTWNQFRDFGKKNYRLQKDAVLPSVFNLSSINENSTPEEIRNALKEDESTSDRRDSVERMMKEIQEKFIEINF